MAFHEQLRHAWATSQSMLCVGLDPDPSRFPEVVDGSVFDFCMAIVDATADTACAFKPQIAYFAATGAERDSVEPFLRHPDGGVFVLCRTSNPGSGDFQSLIVDGEPLYLHVARRIATEWNEIGDCGLVVGATYPAELSEVRAIVGDLPLLVPGVGAQGGDVQATVEAGVDSTGFGMVINSSRAILYASSGEDFAEAARVEAIATRDRIRTHSTR